MSSKRSKRAILLAGAAIFAALGDATRLRLVQRMCETGPASIAVLTEGVGVSRQAVTKHLHVLEDAGLVQKERVGRETSWELLPERLDDARASLDRISVLWDRSIDRLKAFVEEDES